MTCPPRVAPPVLSATFFRRGYEMCQRLGIDWLNLLVAMNFESMGVNPAACNPSSGAAGLIQILGLSGYGWTGSRDEYLSLSAEEQLPSVERYLKPWVGYGLDSFARIHQAIFLPGSLATAKAPGDVVCSATGTRWPNKAGVPQEPVFYEQNKVFDADKKGFITLGDIEAAGSRAASTSRFTQVLGWLKAAVPEMASRIPDRILPVPPPLGTPSRATASFMPLLLLAGLGAGAYMLTRNSGKRIRFA